MFDFVVVSTFHLYPTIVANAYSWKKSIFYHT